MEGETVTTLSVSTAKYLPALRKATDLTIKLDPRTISLIPHTKVNKGGGLYDYQTQTPRAPQTFAVEPVGATLSGITSISGGVVDSESGAQSHQWSYYLIGRYDAEMEIGDTWQDGNTLYRIVAIQPKNDYEKRAVVTAFGRDPNYGA
jgi:hypothetical protein